MERERFGFKRKEGNMRMTFVAPALLLLAILIASAISVNAAGLSFAQKSTTTTLSTNLNPSTFGQNVIFSSSVTGGVPNGEKIVFMDGNTIIGTKSISSGSASLSIGSLAIGTHTITAVYSGDANLAPSTSAIVTQVVSPLGTTTALKVGPNPTTYGQLVTLTATVTGNVPNGEAIVFYDSFAFQTLGTANLTKGVATLTTSNLAAGSHQITARYSGDAKFGSSTSSPVTQIVKQGSSAVSLSTSENSTASGQPVTFTAAVSPEAATSAGEIVTFKDAANVIGTGAILSGAASFTTSLLSSGTHLITAVYPGDSNLTGSTSNPITQVVTKSTSFPGNPTACSLNINVTSASQYYVAPQPIVIYYTVSKSGICSIPTAIGTLSLSSAASGIVYSSIPVNVSNIISTPVTRVIYANSSQAPTGPNEAVLLLTAGGGVSNLSSTTFSVLQPANVTIEKFRVVPNNTRVGSPISVVAEVLNGAFFDANNASLNLRIISPNQTVYKTTTHIGRIPAFRNMTITVNPGINSVPQFQGRYTIIGNVSFYSNYSTSSVVYSSNILNSANSTAQYSVFAAVTVYPNQNTGYNPLLGYPTPPSAIGPATVSSFPFYTEMLTGANSTQTLNPIGIYDSGNFPLTVNFTIPQLQIGRIISSAGSLSVLPGQGNSLRLQFISTGNLVGTYIIPINVSVASSNGSAVASQLQMILSLENKTSTPETLSNIKLLNGNKNASVGISVINPTNQTRYKMFINTKLNSSISGNSANGIALSGQNANLTLSGNTYTLGWEISQLASNGIGQVGYTITNLTAPQGLLMPPLFLSSTKQSNSSSFNIVQINKPQNIYANSTINLTISAIYTGINATILTLGLVPPIGANVLNGQVNIKAYPNSAVDAKFTITTGNVTGNQTFKLVTPGPFGPQTQALVLNIQPKPLAIFQLSNYLDDPRTIFGAATATLYLIVLLYGRIRSYRQKKALAARSTVKKLDELRILGKKINVALLDEGGVKRIFSRHQNPDGSLGGFVEESAIVGKDAFVAPTAIVKDDAIVTGHAKILENATVSDAVVVRAHAVVAGDARVGDDAEVFGNAKIYGKAKVYGQSEVRDSARVYDNAQVFDRATVSGIAEVFGKASVFGSMHITGSARIKDGKMSKGTSVDDS